MKGLWFVNFRDIYKQVRKMKWGDVVLLKADK